MNTIERKIEHTIKNYMYRGKTIVVVGARQVGKTTLLQSIGNNADQHLWLNADENRVRERLTNPSISSLRQIIGNYKLVIIDEIQRIVNAGILLKLITDTFKDVQCIATGSSALEISDRVFEPLTGRYILLHLYPFSLSELYSNKSPFEIEDELQFHLIYGSYPEICIKKDIAELIIKNLSQQYLYKDVLIWKNIRKPELLDKLLQLLSYQVGSEVSVYELAKQLKIKSETVENYIDLLEKSFVIYRLKSYSKNPRKEISKMNKIFFWDNGIRNSVIDNFNDINFRNDQGQLFENFIISERLKKHAWAQASVRSYFWRNYNQSEVDYLEETGEKLAAYEIKWNSNKKHKVSASFTNQYPLAQTEILQPNNFVPFIF